jgi:hypothetical protein
VRWGALTLGPCYLPDFSLPFPEQSEHPDAAEVEAAACAWARDRGLVDEAGHRRSARHTSEAAEPAAGPAPDPASAPARIPTAPTPCPSEA